MNRRRTDNPSRNLKGSVRFWLKGDALAKYEFNYQGSNVIGLDGGVYEINRTTAVGIKGVGSTKEPIPDEAKKKL